MRPYLFASLALSLTLPVVGTCQTNCSDALVKSTYRNLSSSHLDRRLATFVSQSSYEEIKHNAGANATIYGVPVGASYGDFQQRSSQSSQSVNQSLTQDEATNILWTGLDPNAPSAYSACLQSISGQQRGIHLAVKAASDSEVTILVTWHPEGSDPSYATLGWQWSGGGASRLPKTVAAGSTMVVLPRPGNATMLTVNFIGSSDNLMIVPLPKIIPIPHPRGVWTFEISAVAHEDAHCSLNGVLVGIVSHSQGSQTFTVLPRTAGTQEVYCAYTNPGVPSNRAMITVKRDEVLQIDHLAIPVDGLPGNIMVTVPPGDL